jgi:tripartite-type tricarboxylate transporter receptor subunit TctC
MKILKAIVAFACVAFASINLVSPAAAAYPERPVKIVVPYPAGGGSDALARMIAKKLGDDWGQPIVIDNKPGADTQIGNSAVATAAPDGYTLLLIATTFTMHKNMVASLPYDPMKDFVPIAGIGVYPYWLVVPTDFPAKTAADLIAYAKKNPGKLNHAVSSGGQYVLAELMKRGAGIDAVGVRYKGGSEAVRGILGGDVQYHLDQPGTFKSLIDSGKLRVLAQTGDKRSPAAPDAPTFAEAGLAGGEVTSWLGLAAPKGTPQQIVEFINASVRKALDSPDVKQQLEQLIAVPMPMSVSQFDAFVRKESERYEQTIKKYGLKY